MKAKQIIFLLSCALACLPSLWSEPPSEFPWTRPASFTEEQNSLFDELLEQEQRRKPEAAKMVQENPAKAVTLVEDDESYPAPTAAPRNSPVIGTFIQLSREWSKLETEDWNQLFDIIEYAGLETIIIQWTASEEIAYFEPAPEQYTETYPVLNHLFEALEGRNLQVVLGLSSDPDYWTNISTRNDVRDVYFRVRNTHDLRVQEALLELFGDNSNWTGYYLSEEIDDINWREPADEEVFHQFLLRAGRIIQERDKDRPVSISSFFRKRTAPSTYATNLYRLMTNTVVSRLWIQDGIGVFPLSSSLIEPYFQTLSRQFNGNPTQLGVVVELFETTSKPDEPFQASPALASRVKNQLKNASMVGGPIVLFSLLDYADPRKGGNEKEIYEVICQWNLQNKQISDSKSPSSAPPAQPATTKPPKTVESPPPEEVDSAETQIQNPGLPAPEVEPKPEITPLSGLRKPKS